MADCGACSAGQAAIRLVSQWQEASGSLSHKPKLRDSVIVQRDGPEVVFLLTGSRVVKRFVVNDHVLKLIPLLDGSRTVEQLCDQVGAGSREAADEVMKALDVMRRERLLSVVDGSWDAALLDTGDDAELKRYDRQIRLFQDLCDEGLSSGGRGIDLQRRLQQATAVVCGLGGVGSWLVQGLAAAGVGTLRICDFDQVEVSNLGRQILYSTSDIGRLKTEAAAERVAVVNPHVRVEPVTRRITSPDDLSATCSGSPHRRRLVRLPRGHTRHHSAPGHHGVLAVRADRDGE